MNVINGLPAHALLLHLVVVLVPLTALLEIVCGSWPAAPAGPAAVAHAGTGRRHNGDNAHHHQRRSMAL